MVFYQLAMHILVYYEVQEGITILKTWELWASFFQMEFLSYPVYFAYF